MAKANTIGVLTITTMALIPEIKSIVKKELCTLETQNMRVVLKMGKWMV